MGGVKTIDMRAHGTQKTKTEVTCSHKTKTQAHGQQTNHQPCAKQDTNTQPMNIQAACHTTKHTWTEEHTAEQTRDRTLTQRDRMWSASVQTPTRTETQDMSAGIRTPRSNTKQGTQTRERTTRAHSKPHVHMKPGHDGSIRALSQTMNNTRPKRQNPDKRTQTRGFD